MIRLTNFLARHCRGFAVLLLVSGLLPASFLPRVRIDNSIEAWLRQESPEFHQYQKFQDRFGNEEFVVAALALEDPLSEAHLTLQQELARDLAAIPGVGMVLSVPDLCRGLRDLPGWKEGVRSHPFFRGLLIGPDGRNAGLFLMLDRLQGPEARRRIVEGIHRVTSRVEKMGVPVHLAGTPVMSAALDDGSEHSARTFLPVAVVVSLAILFVMLRNPALVIAPLCAVGLSVTWTVGLMAMTGHALNMVTVVLPALLFVLALSNGIHLASRFAHYREGSGDPNQAVRSTLRELIRPVSLSSITTAVGFSVLAVSDMAPVRDLGTFAAIGMLIALVCNLLLVPGMLVLLSPGSRPMRAVMQTPGLHRAGMYTARRFIRIFLLSVGLAGAGALFATQLTTESNVLKFFPRSSRIARDYAFIGTELTGFYTLEMDLRVSKGDEKAAWDAMKALSKAVTARPDVVRVEHAASLDAFFSEMEDLTMGGLPAGLSALRDAFRSRYRRPEDGFLHLRLSILTRAMESAAFYDLLAFVSDRAKEILPPVVSWETTGVVSLLNDLQRSLVGTQVKSLSMAAALVILMIGVLFRSFRAAAASILPNGLPIFGVLGVMALARIPLDPATVMIASVAIGIAADDTIHFLARYGDERRSGRGPEEATAETIRAIGSALVFTSVVAASGFAMLCLAPFRPIVHFGLLTGLAMLTALAADLLILPPCARLFRL